MKARHLYGVKIRDDEPARKRCATGAVKSKGIISLIADVVQTYETGGISPGVGNAKVEWFETFIELSSGFPLSGLIGVGLRPISPTP